MDCETPQSCGVSGFLQSHLLQLQQLYNLPLKLMPLCEEIHLNEIMFISQVIIISILKFVMGC